MMENVPDPVLVPSVTETFKVTMPILVGDPLIDSVLPVLLAASRPSFELKVVGVPLVGIVVPLIVKV